MIKILMASLLIFTLSFSDDLESFEEEYKAPAVKFDPLEGYNRAMTSFNDFIFTNALSPVAKAYKNTVDKSIRTMIANFFSNLAFPMRFINNTLQGKFKNSLDELCRFIVNTTMGVGGFGDAGSEIFGIQAHHEDFGQTLGFYGIGSGFPVVLPLLGPSNLRDMVGLGGDYFTSATTYFESKYLALGFNIGKSINELSFHVDELETARRNVLDLYPFLQEFYETKRQEAIKN